MRLSQRIKLAHIRTEAYNAGYRDMMYKLAIESKAIRSQPLSSTGDARLDAHDDGTPAGDMANLFTQMEDPVTRDSEKKQQQPMDNVEDRLNRPAGWSEASTISMEDATGPSPIMTGQY